jgi:phenylalanyl-tRNA synthetase beta chain
VQASFEWIRSFLPDLKVTPAAVEKRFNQSGVAVDGVRRPQEALQGVIVGEVRECVPHPNSDQLSLTRVFDGEAEHAVVCGAPNVAAGQKVPFAPIGTSLPNGLRIEARTVRGVESRGMLCAADELGLALSSDGIMVLKPRLRAGRPVADALGVKDVIFDLDLTPNRPDLLSHFGLAREVAALFDLSTPRLSARVKESGEAASASLKVSTKDRDRCPLYTARVIRGVKVGPSPLSIQQRLLSLGQRPVSNVVDATNMVLLELGQPLHAFDLARLSGGRLTARLATEGERIELLDGSTKALTPDDLVIADGAQAVALAGVMGGANSEVSDATVDIVLESAYFSSASVRRTARRHGLHTEASHRFERRVDPMMVERALDACAALIVELAGGTVATGPLQAGRAPSDDGLVPIRPERASTLLGHPVGRTEIRSTLKRLRLTSVAVSKVPKRLLKQRPDALWFRPPSWRVDLAREVDLIEEVARLDGYDRIPSAMPPGSTTVRSDLHASRLDLGLRRTLVGLGCMEAVSLGFCSDRDFDAFGASKQHRVQLANPLGEETAFLRFSILPALLAAARRNQDLLPSRVDLRLFELGRTFGWGDTKQPLPVESRRLGLVLRGRRHPAGWATADDPIDAYDLKGMLEAVFDRLGLPRFEVRAAEAGFLHPRSSGQIHLGHAELGWMGELHPDVADRYGLEGPPVFVAELSVDGLLRLDRPPAGFVALSPHPPAQRDLSFFVDRSQPASAVLATIRAAAQELESVEVFDVYEGAHAPEGMRSLAVALVFRAADRTLEHDEVEATQRRIVEALKAQHGAELRGGRGPADAKS